MYIIKKRATFPQKTVWTTSKNVENFSKKYVEKPIFPKSYPQTFVFSCEKRKLSTVFVRA